MSKTVKLDYADVVSAPKEKSPIAGSTFKVSQMSFYIARLMSLDARVDHKDWGNAGVECEVLRVSGGGWQKGSVRISLEFTPDEPEEEKEPQEAVLLPPAKPKSPLDDLRDELLKNE